MPPPITSIAELKALAIIPKIGGSFSIVGSCLILRDIGKRWHKVALTTEVMAHITIANLFTAFWECFLSTWMVPRGSDAFMATGTIATCSTQGLISTAMFIILEISYAILAVLYWIIVARGWTERKTQRRKTRFFFLGLPVLIALGFAISMFFLKMYNFNGTYSCGISEYPLNCDLDPDVACERGTRHARRWQAAMGLGVLLCTIVIIVFLSLLVKSVLTQERKHDRYLLEGQAKKRETTQKTLWQAVRFFVVFFLTNFPYYLWIVIDILGMEHTDVITFFYVTLWPMFGVFNSCAYFRPKYLSYKEKNKEKSCWQCLMAILEIDFGSWCKGPDDREPMSVSEMMIDAELESPLFQEEDSGKSSDAM